MFPRFPTFLFLIFMLPHCSRPATADPLADLDYVEVKNHTGWVLRIHGDGGGSLGHQQLPAHHLHYPAATFAGAPGRRLARRCRGRIESTVCEQVTYYASRLNTLTVCACSPGGWTTEVMEQAIAEMQFAVDSGGDERSCRMLRKRWLAAR